MEPSVKPLDRDRLSVLIATILLGNVLFQFIELPQQLWRIQLLGSPLQINLTGSWILIGLTVGLVCTATSVLLTTNPLLTEHADRPIFVSWILPAVLSALLTAVLEQLGTAAEWIVGLAVLGIALGITLAAEYQAVSPASPGYALARLALNVLAYLLAFVLFAVIYRTRARSVITAPLTLLAAVLLSLDLLSVADVPLSKVLLFAGVIGLIIGESTWALNYWRVSTWVAGLFLLLIFYVLTNLSHQHLLNRLGSTTLLELAVITIIVLVIVLVSRS